MTARDSDISVQGYLLTFTSMLKALPTSGSVPHTSMLNFWICMGQRIPASFHINVESIARSFSLPHTGNLASTFWKTSNPLATDPTLDRHKMISWNKIKVQHKLCLFCWPLFYIPSHVHGHDLGQPPCSI